MSDGSEYEEEPMQEAEGAEGEEGGGEVNYLFLIFF